MSRNYFIYNSSVSLKDSCLIEVTFVLIFIVIHAIDHVHINAHKAANYARAFTAEKNCMGNHI